MKSRIPLLPIDQALEAAKTAGLSEGMARLSIFRVLLHHPKLAKQIQDLLFSLLFGAELDVRLRELLIMRIGWATGSVYEWTQHWRVALELGVEEADVLAVRDWKAHAHWSSIDRAVLTATDEVLADGMISAETWAACAEGLPRVEEQLELVAAIGTWGMISRILRSLEIPLEDGVEPWPPDGRIP